MKYTKWVILLSALSVLIIITGCNNKTEVSYYPLDEGLTWVYHISSGDGHSKGEKQVSMKKTNLAKRYVKGQKVTPQQIDFNGKSVIKYIIHNDRGIYEFAEKQPDALSPEIIDPSIFYIRAPISVGSTWTENYTTKHVMERIIVPVKVNIQSLNESVTVPAGTFHKCLKLCKSGQLEKNNGKYFGVSKTIIEENSWYASGVGLVKSEFSEISTHRMSGVEREVTVLASFNKK